MGLVGAIVELSGGNIRNNHIYVRGCEGLFPRSAFGGENRETAGEPILLELEGGEIVETDIASDKMIFRNRSAIGRFFRSSGVREGSKIRILLMKPNHFKILLEEL